MGTNTNQNLDSFNMAMGIVYNGWLFCPENNPAPNPEGRRLYDQMIVDITNINNEFLKRSLLLTDRATLNLLRDQYNAAGYRVIGLYYRDLEGTCFT